MNPDLERLIRLQELETDLRRLRSELEEVPSRRADLEAKLAADRGRLDAARQALEDSQRTRRQKEGQLQDLESRRSKYKGQLMDVKTNKEYTAMLHEIEAVEREISATEDLILVEMERADELNARARQEEGAFREAEADHAREAAALEARAAGLQAERDRRTADRDEVAQTLSEELRERFARVARLRGAAVAEARDGTCQGCRVKLRPQLYVDIKRNDAVRQCDACSRILYYQPPAPEVAPAP